MNKKSLVIGILLPFTFYMTSFAQEKNETKKVESKLEAKLYGNIKSFSLKVPSTWLIKNKSVFVNNETILDERYGKLAKGVYVEVKGYYSGKTFIAKKIEVRGNDEDDEKEKNDKDSK